jgi:hypothetical protein
MVHREEVLKLIAIVTIRNAESYNRFTSALLKPQHRDINDKWPKFSGLLPAS